LFLLVCFVLAANAKDLKNLKGVFEHWKQTHQKVYPDADEEARRFDNFVVSIRTIHDLNRKSNGTGAKFGLTKFADMTTEEFSRSFKLSNPLRSTGLHAEYEVPQEFRNMAVPSSIDWRTKGVVTAIKNQEQCGSCWAFSVTEAIESAWMIAKGIKNTTFLPLAPQQIVDCDQNDGGCNGGDPPTAYQYVISAGGLEKETSYPYTGTDGSCKFVKSKVESKISSWKYATSEYDEVTLKKSVASFGPLSICVDAANWQYYQSGVMGGWQCAWINELDHCVQVIGYDMQASTPYWLVRNSWGVSWGESGNIRLSYGDNTCGLTNEATYPIV